MQVAKQGKTAVKSVYTTGEVAEICNVSQQTVIRCFDSGKLKGFRVPGSRFRRIPHESLLQFMKDNAIPLDNLESGKKRILAVDDDPQVLAAVGRDLRSRYAGDYRILRASSGAEALEAVDGLLARGDAIALFLADQRMPEMEGTEFLAEARQRYPDAKRLLLTAYADTAAAIAAAPSWQKPTSCTWMSPARLYACRAAWTGLQAFTMPTGEMHIAELELGMLPRAAMRGTA